MSQPILNPQARLVRSWITWWTGKSWQPTHCLLQHLLRVTSSVWALKHVGHHECTLLLSVVLWTEEVRNHHFKSTQRATKMWTGSKPISPENNQPCNACSPVSAASPRRRRLLVHLSAGKYSPGYCEHWVTLHFHEGWIFDLRSRIISLTP